MTGLGKVWIGPFWRNPSFRKNSVEDFVARFCAFGVHSLKALAFCRQLELDEEAIDSLKKLYRFLRITYIPHFLSASIGCDSFKFITTPDIDYKWLEVDPEL